MRTQQIQNVLVTYPDELVWKQDTSAIKVEGVSNIGATIVIANPAQNYYVLEYYSDQDTLLFYLDDAIRALYDDNIGAWYCKVTVFNGSTSLGSFNFNFNVLNGKSFITRSHGISSTIYVYDREELRKLQIFSPQQGIAIMDQWGFNCYYGLNQFNLYTAIQQSGEYQICLRDSQQTPALVDISGTDPVDPYSELISFSVMGAPLVNETHGGDVFAENKLIYPICHNIVFQDHCDDYNFGEIRYTDLDGMCRYLGGKVFTDEDNVKDESYFTSNVDSFNRVPNRYITSHEKVIKMYLTDIDKNAYPHDLLYSQDIQFRMWNGEWKNIALKTNKFERKDEDSYDIELEIIVSQ